MTAPLTTGLDWLAEQRSVRDVTLAEVVAAINSNRTAQEESRSWAQTKKLRAERDELWAAKRQLEAEARADAGKGKA